MPTRVAQSSSPPTISLPSQLASQSRQDISSAIASTSRTFLQATPDSSFSNGHGFTIGSVVKISHLGVRRSRNAAVFASADQGVVIVDPSTQTATSSHSFSPSLQPITPPLVIQTSAIQSTIICLASRNEIDSAEIHVWTQGRDSLGTLEEEVEHRTCKIDASARSLHALLDGSILVHHADGKFSSTSKIDTDEVQISNVEIEANIMPERIWIHHISVLDKYAASSISKASQQHSREGLIVRVYSADSSSLKPKVRRSARKSAIEVIDALEGGAPGLQAEQTAQGTVHLEVIDLDDDNSVKLVGSLDVMPILGIHDAKEVRDVTLFHSGRLVFSFADGRIVSTYIELQATGNTIAMHSMSTTSLPAALQHNVNIKTLSLQLVSASTALITLAEPTKDSITALLIDLDLKSILSSTAWNSKDVQTLTTHRVAGSVVLVLATCNDSSSKIATNLWTLPYTISEGNHLRWALKSADLTRQWIGLAADPKTADESERGRRQLLKEVERILTNKKETEASNAIDEAFSKWHKKETSRLESIWLNSIEKETMRKGEASSDSDEDPDRESKRKSQKTNGKTNGKAPLPTYPTRFVSDLLKMVLPSPDEVQAPQKKSVYAKQTVHHLLSAQVISHSTRKDLLSSFRALEDWDAILMTLRLVHDLHEMDVIETLHQIVESSQNATTGSQNKLETFMTVFTSVILDHSQLRAALKTYFKDVNEVIVVMDNLSSWLDQTQESLLLMHGFEVSENGTSNGGAKKRRKQVQSSRRLFIKVNKVLHLLCDLLDTYFPLFLNTESSHSHLKRLSQQISEQLTMYNQLMILKGPLAAFARLQADQEKEARIQEKRKQRQDAEEKLMSLRKADKKAIQAKQNRIGQVGGGIGKSHLGEKSRRRQLYEENVAVGLYNLETLDW